MHHRRVVHLYAPIFAVGMVLCSVVNADPMYHVSVNTSALNGKGTFYVEFQLVDGSSVGGDGDALAIVKNFSITGMSLGQVLEPTFGSVSGSLSGILTLRDGPPAFGVLADFAQAFSVTNSTSLIDFDLELAATNVNTPVADMFSLLILDSFAVPLPTNGPLGVELVTAAFTTSTPTPVAFSASSPPVTATVTAVPEPSTLAMSATAAILLCCVRFRRRYSEREVR